MSTRNIYHGATSTRKFAPQDENIRLVAIALLEKMFNAPGVIALERESLREAVAAVAGVPNRWPDSEIVATLAGLPSTFVSSGDECQLFRSWEIEISSQGIEVIRMGVCRWASTGAEGFEYWRWSLERGSPPSVSDQSARLRHVPPIPSFEEDIRRLDLAGPNFVIDVTDLARPALPMKGFNHLLRK